MLQLRVARAPLHRGQHRVVVHGVRLVARAEGEDAGVQLGPQLQRGAGSAPPTELHTSTRVIGIQTVSSYS